MKTVLDQASYDRKITGYISKADLIRLNPKKVLSSFDTGEHAYNLSPRGIRMHVMRLAYVEVNEIVDTSNGAVSVTNPFTLRPAQRDINDCTVYALDCNKYFIKEIDKKQ